MLNLTPPELVWLFASCLYGLMIGSFLNVVIYRLPRGLSVAKPVWSYCPNCEHRLGTMDLVPVLSFLMLGRKCRYCKQPISWRYASVELLTAVLFGLVCLHDGPGFDTVFDALFVSLLIPAFFIDLEHFIIPDEINVLGFVVGVAHSLVDSYLDVSRMSFSLTAGPVPILDSIKSGIICALIFHLISFIGLIYYGSRRKEGPSLASSIKSFWMGVADDYAYLIVKFLGFGLWLPAAKRFVKSREELDSDFAAAEIADVGKSRDEIAEAIENDDEQTGMGQGDAKLALMIGANLLLVLSLESFFIAVLSGTVIGVIMTRGRGKAAIPFGPFLAIGAVVALIWGSDILNWYANYAHLSIVATSGSHV